MSSNNMKFTNYLNINERNVGEVVRSFSDRIIVSAENKIELRINSNKFGDVYLLLSKNELEYFIEDIEEAVNDGKTVTGDNYEISFKKNVFSITSFAERKEHKFVIKEDSIEDNIESLITSIANIGKKIK